MAMTRHQLMNECDMLQGNVNIMMITYSMQELVDIYYYASSRLCSLYIENVRRIEDGKNSKAYL